MVIGSAAALDLVFVCSVPMARWMSMIWPFGNPQVQWVRRLRWRLAYLLLLGLAILLLRLRVMGRSQPIFNQRELPHKYHPNWWTRVFSLHQLVGFNAGLLVAPTTLCHDWAYGSIPLTDSVTDARLLPTAAIYVLSLLLLALTATAPMWRDKERRPTQSAVLLLGAALTMTPFLPSANLFFDVGFVVAERVLYIPSMGYTMLLVVGYLELRRRSSTAVACTLLVVALSLLSAKTIQRNQEWHSNLRYSSHHKNLYVCIHVCMY